MPINIFKKYTKAKSGEVNDNFALIAGNKIVAFNPIDGSPVTGFDIGDLTRTATGSLVNDILARSGQEIIVYNVAGAEIGRVTYDDLLNQGQATTTVKGAALLPKVIEVKNSTIDPNKDIEFSAGVMQFNDGSGQAATNDIIKRLDADFAIGTNQGGMPATVIKSGTYTSLATAVTGASSSFDTDFKVGDIIFSSSNSIGRRITAIADSTNLTIDSAFPVDVSGDNVAKNGLAPDATYHLFTISDEDGLNTDAGYDTQIDASNLLADTVVAANSLDKLKKAASLVTDGAANIRNGNYVFNLDGSYIFDYNAIISDFAGSPVDAFTTQKLTVPSLTLARLQLRFVTNFGETSGRSVIFRDNISGQEFLASESREAVGSNTIAQITFVDIQVDDASSLDIRVPSGTGGTLNINTRGWFDNN